MTVTIVPDHIPETGSRAPRSCTDCVAAEWDRPRATRPAKPKRLTVWPLLRKEVADPCLTASIFFVHSAKQTKLLK